jgi:hypothetical protein
LTQRGPDQNGRWYMVPNTAVYLSGLQHGVNAAEIAEKAK